MKPLIGLALLFLPSGALAQSCPSAAPERPDQVVATFNGEAVTLSQLDGQIAAQLCKASLDHQRARYEARSNALNEMLTDRLVAAEIKVRKLTGFEALAEQLTAGIAPPSEAEAKAFFAGQAQADAPPFDTIKGQVIKYLHDQARRAAIQTFMTDLRTKAKVRVTLPVVRVKVAATGPSKGPADAPITIVEFADYQCPYCAKGAATLEKVRQRYADKVRVVFRDFPLGFHDQAVPAAVTARCAGAQGKYWEMHDVLFANVSQLDADSRRGYAKGLGLDLAKYDACVADPTHAAAVTADQAAGAAVGVGGTPAYFINGVSLEGAQPESAFVDLIEQALSESQ